MLSNQRGSLSSRVSRGLPFVVVGFYIKVNQKFLKKLLFPQLHQAVINHGYLLTYKESYDDVEVFSFACPFFPLHTAFSLFVAKNAITFNFFTNIHFNMTIFYLSIGKVLFVRLIILPPGTSICLTNRTLQIDKRQKSH
jgi:hypothetical protein